MKQCTERDKEILHFIMEYTENHGYSPSVREIGKSLYLSSTTTYRHLYKLVELGYLSMTPKTPRSIVIRLAV